jgi:hypothetical protein
MRGAGWAVLAAGLLLAAPAAAEPGGEAEEAFARRTMILSVLVGGGAQNNIQSHGSISGVTLLNLGYRMSYLPFEPFGSGWYRGAFEPGLEGWFQYYLEPDSATAQGAKLAFRYNFLGLGGRLVPYVEALAGVGGTSLKVKEIRSTVTFVLEVGVGLQYLLNREMAVYGGYRFHHLSNGNVESPNRGIEADTGVVGLSFFFH